VCAVKTLRLPSVRYARFNELVPEQPRVEGESANAYPRAHGFTTPATKKSLERV
jgi:hypothetical protein